MSDFKTRLDTEEGSNKTTLESRDQDRKTVLESGAPTVRGAGLRKDDVFAGFRIIERLRVVSLEADLYVVERVENPQRFMLKLYRPEFRPREDILNKVHSLRREHIVEIVETGTVDDSFYEIQEYVRHGSLADMLKGGALSDAKTKEALKEMATALAHLHEVDVLHRDIKPSNILVRTKEPQLDLVLTDFGLSRETDLSFVQASRLGGTAAYSAPEASTKGLVKKSDWWSVGIILIEMLTGRHPFSGISDLAISMHVATRPVTIPESLSADWKLIIKGLLTRDPQRRWGFEQVSQWLDGKRDIPISFESETAVGPSALHSHRPYRLGGQDYFHSADLATGLAQNWEEGVKRVGRLHILNWVKEDLRDDDMTNALQDLADDRTLNEYHKLALAIIILNRELPLIWEDKVVDQSWMRSNPKLAVAMLESSLPTWLRKLRNESWMMELQKRRKEIWKALRPSPAQSAPLVNPELAEQLILGPPELAHAQAKATKETTFNSQNEAIEKALRRTALDDAEAILLASCNRSLLWTRDQEKIRQAEAAKRQREAEIAERERQRKLREEEEAHRKTRGRTQRFTLGNILGWLALASFFLMLSACWHGCFLLSPIVLLPFALSGVSAYFVIDYWRHESHREPLRGGHKAAFGIIGLVGLIVGIATVASLFSNRATSNATGGTSSSTAAAQTDAEKTASQWPIKSPNLGAELATARGSDSDRTTAQSNFGDKNFSSNPNNTQPSPTRRLFTPPKNNEPFPGERFPQTRQKIITADDIRNWSKSDLAYALLEMFARYGGSMPSPGAASKFREFGWYHDRGISFENINQTNFSDIERQNASFLSKTMVLNSKAFAGQWHGTLRMTLTPRIGRARVFNDDCIFDVTDDESSIRYVVGRTNPSPPWRLVRDGLTARWQDAGRAPDGSVSGQGIGTLRVAADGKTAFVNIESTASNGVRIVQTGRVTRFK